MRKIDYVFIVLIFGTIGFVVGQQSQLNGLSRISEHIVDILEMDRELDKAHNEIDSLIIANINRIYEHLGVEWEIRSLKRDTISRRWNPETEKWEEEG